MRFLNEIISGLEVERDKRCQLRDAYRNAQVSLELIPEYVMRVADMQAEVQEYDRAIELLKQDL